MLSKYNRKKFYRVAQIPGTNQFMIDVLSLRWLQFQRVLNRRRLKSHTVEAHEEGRLWLISDRFYERDDLDFILALANNILDPIGGFKAGDSLAIPRKEDIDSFFQAIEAEKSRGQTVRVAQETL